MNKNKLNQKKDNKQNKKLTNLSFTYLKEYERPLLLAEIVSNATKILDKGNLK